MELFRYFKSKFYTDSSTKKSYNDEFFSEIPYHNQLDILKKLDFKDFVKFKQCSLETVEMAKNFRYRLPFNVSKIWIDANCIRVDTKLLKEVEYNTFYDEPIRFITRELNIYEDQANGILLEDFVGKFVLKTGVLHFGVDGAPEILNNLIKISRATMLQISPFVNLSALLEQPDVRKLEGIIIINKKIEETDLLQLEMSNIFISKDHGLTLSTINKFLKQWVDRKRTIDKLAILPIPREEDHLEIFENLEFSVERTSGNQTIRNHVPKIYSLTREDGKKLFVSLEQYDDEPGIVVRESDDLKSFVRLKHAWAVL